MRRWHSFFDFRISTHAPREGCDREMVIHSLVLSYFNSRTPCGVRHRSLPKVPPETYFNSRTQCGVRTRCSVSSAVVVSFQLTHPMRGTTSSICCRDGSNRISTHAPRTGCDAGKSTWVGSVLLFNSRTHTGYDNSLSPSTDLWSRFQPTSPTRDASLIQLAYALTIQFQLTHPMRGAT